MATDEQIKQKRLERRLRNSQIAPLLVAFRESPYRFAPEFQHDLVRIQQALGITILPVWPENRFYFAADLDRHRIECGICAMERLWAYAYIYGKLAQAQPSTEIRKDSDFYFFLVWAHQPPGVREIPWPSHATSPAKDPAREDVKLANELFLGMSAFILFHEIGHLIKGDAHCTRLIDAMRHNHQHEFEADEIAWDFAAFNALRDGTDAVKKKRVGILILALAVIAVDAAYRGGALISDTHPRPIDRIDRLIAYLHKWGDDGGTLANAAEQIAARILYSAAAIIMELGGQPITERKVFSSPRETITYSRTFLEIPLEVNWDAALDRNGASK